jgi:imidazole glycerol-phosphate synthase subunit HisF
VPAKREHFIEAFHQARVDGALAATVFHSGPDRDPRLKAALAANGVEVRRPGMNGGR